MHIIIHTQYYPPEIGAPQARLHALAIGLVRHGIQTTVLAAIPNYPQGRIYDGYRGWLQIENLDGVRVLRTAIYPTHKAKMLSRMLSYLSFTLSSVLLGARHIGKADIVLTESPPLFLGLAGFVLSRWKRARWIFNISDLWPESVVELGVISKESWSYKLSSVLERFLYRRAWVVTGQAKIIVENIQKRYSDVRVIHWPNGVDTDRFQPREQLKNVEFQFVYAGLHGLAQGLEQVVYAAQKLSAVERIVFRFVGDGPEKEQLMQMATQLNLHNISFSDAVALERVPEILGTANAIIVPLKTQLTGAVPSKLYEAMAMGKPVILIAEGEAKRIVDDSNCGIVVHPGDVDGLVTAMLHLEAHPETCKQMGENGRRSAVHHHDRTRIVDEFSAFLLRNMLGNE